VSVATEVKIRCRPQPLKETGCPLIRKASASHAYSAQADRQVVEIGGTERDFRACRDRENPWTMGEGRPAERLALAGGRHAGADVVEQAVGRPAVPMVVAVTGEADGPIAICKGGECDGVDAICGEGEQPDRAQEAAVV